MSHGDENPRPARLRDPLVILAQSAVAPRPGERPLHDPAPRRNRESLLPLGADDQLPVPTFDLLGPRRDPPRRSSRRPGSSPAGGTGPRAPPGPARPRPGPGGP